MGLEAYLVVVVVVDLLASPPGVTTVSLLVSRVVCLLAPPLLPPGTTTVSLLSLQPPSAKAPRTSNTHAVCHHVFLKWTAPADKDVPGK